MLNKELFLLGSTQGQRKVKLTIGRNTYSANEFDYGYALGNAGSLDLLPYWGAMKAKIQSLSSYSRTGFYLTNNSVVVTAYVEGYPQAITSGSLIRGDIYNMFGNSGDVRYLTFDPPPMGTWIQRHSNQSRKRLLRRRRSSLGGSKC